MKTDRREGRSEEGIDGVAREGCNAEGGVVRGLGGFGEWAEGVGGGGLFLHKYSTPRNRWGLINPEREALPAQVTKQPQLSQGSGFIVN